MLCTENRAKSIIAIISILCLMSTASTAFEYQLNTEGNCTPKDVEIPNNNCTIQTEPTNLGKNETYRSVFYWFSSIFFGLLPLVLIATFNCFLVTAVYKSQKQRKLMTNLQVSYF